MKWRKGDTGAYHWNTVYWGRRAGWSIRVEEAGFLGRHDGTWSGFAEHKASDTVFNSLWKRGPFATAEEGMGYMEAFAAAHPNGYDVPQRSNGTA